MERVFLQILEMSMTGSACILFVLALRALLRKKPKSFSYVLWAVVFLRLLCPFALQSRYFGLTLGNMEQTLETAAYEQELVQYQLLVHKDGTVETLTGRNVLGIPGEEREIFHPDTAGENFFPQEEAWGTDRAYGDYGNQGGFVNRRYSRSAMLRLERRWVTACSMIWAAGVAALLGYSLVSYLLLRRRLRQAVRVQEDVYESDLIHTPFLLGVLDPRIYLPVGLSQEEKAYVLAHELAHLKRGDYLVKLVTWLALSLHWFNPLVWLAYGLMVRDMEMSCDERVIRRLGEGSKKAYSQTLLTISSASGGTSVRRFLTAAPLSFGENDIRSRVKNILAYRSVKIGTGAALALLLAAAGVILLTNRQTAGEDTASQPAENSEELIAGKQLGGEGTPAESQSPKESETSPVNTGTDKSDGDGWGSDYLVDNGIYEGVYEEVLNQLSVSQQAEESGRAGRLEILRETDRGSEMTWELLQTLVEKKNPQLEDYAGYAGAVWPDESDGDGNSNSLNRYLCYFLYDADTDQSYRLSISYWKEDLALESVYLRRESDGDTRLLYRDRVAEGKGLYRDAEIEAFRQDIKRLGDWIGSWELPHEEQVLVGEYQADLTLGGGVLFTWKGEERDLKDAWAPEDWKGAGGFMRVGNADETEYDRAPFVFNDKGRLTDLRILMNHTDYNASAEVLEGCQEQAVLVSVNHDLYTLSELDELAEAGRPVPEEETTANFWYIGFAREDAPYGYVLFLAERYYTKEEAVAMARSIRFTEEAWAADSVSP